MLHQDSGTLGVQFLHHHQQQHWYQGLTSSYLWPAAVLSENWVGPEARKPGMQIEGH